MDDHQIPTPPMIRLVVGMGYLSSLGNIPAAIGAFLHVSPLCKERTVECARLRSHQTKNDLEIRGRD